MSVGWSTLHVSWKRLLFVETMGMVAGTTHPWETPWEEDVAA